MKPERRACWARSNISYCSNVHPGETFEELMDQTLPCVGQVRALRGLESMGAGLWLANQVVSELLAEKAKMQAFLNCLRDHKIDLFTLNGFPYGQFHQAQIKEKVYYPDWSDPFRLNYTLNLARILAQCLPEDCKQGTISTLPLGMGEKWSNELHHRAIDQLCDLAKELHELETGTGQRIMVCLEMEPGCVLESTDQIIDFFTMDVPETAQRKKIDPEIINNHLGICFDICHQAVMFEDPFESIRRIQAADIKIGKIQISSALEMTQPGHHSAAESLECFDEPRYLHQVRTRLPGDRVIGAQDLNLVLNDIDFPRENPWRIHFHIPVQAGKIEGFGLATTQTSIARVLDYCNFNPEFRPHLEVETYTWDVLPGAMRPGNTRELLVGITNELRWVESEMSMRGLLEQ